MISRSSIQVTKVLQQALKNFCSKAKPSAAQGVVKEKKVSAEGQKESINQKLPVSPIFEPYNVPNPKIADKKYFWCSCGLSETQPFCNGKHKGTEFKSFKFTVDDSVEVMSLCGCKLTKTVPYCDQKSCKCAPLNAK